MGWETRREDGTTRGHPPLGREGGGGLQQRKTLEQTRERGPPYSVKEGNKGPGKQGQRGLSRDRRSGTTLIGLLFQFRLLQILGFSPRPRIFDKLSHTSSLPVYF